MTNGNSRASHRQLGNYLPGPKDELNWGTMAGFTSHFHYNWIVASREPSQMLISYLFLSPQHLYVKSIAN